MTPDQINTRYVLVHDGLWMYYLASDIAATRYYGRDQATAYADGQPMTRLNDEGWWAADHEAGEITLSIPQPPRTTSFTLDDPATQSERFPATLTPEEYRRLADSSDVYCSLYLAVREDVPPEIITVPGPWTPLDGAPPPSDGHTWNATLPVALTQRGEYRHLFPGHLSSLRAHLEAVIKRMPGVRYCHADKGRLDVTIEVPLALPEHEWVVPSDRRRKKWQREVTVTRRLSLPVPDFVSGENRAAAVAVWDEQVAHWIDIVTAATAKACNTCKGTGHVLDGATEFEKKF